MFRARNQGDDATFRWARTEMKRELALSTSTYAKIAGIQSEVGRVVVTRVAGNELEYKRRLNMYHRDMTCNVNNIRREQLKMRRKMGRYVKKMRQTRIEHAKMIKEQERHDKERAELEELHLRLKFEAASKTPEPGDEVTVIGQDGSNDSPAGALSPSEITLEGNAFYIQTGTIKPHISTVDDTGKVVEASPEKDTCLKESDKPKDNTKLRTRKESRVFSPILPMIDEDAEKECEDAKNESDHGADQLNSSLEIDASVLDDSEFLVPRRKKRKKGVSFSDIIKLKYAGTKHLFDLVNILAKKHGIPDVVERVPDPRDNVVHRGSTNGSFRLEAAILYPMKYGYVKEGLKDKNEMNSFFDNGEGVNNTEISQNGDPFVSDTKLPEVTVFSEEQEWDKDYPKRLRKLSLEERRAMYLSGNHSWSMDSLNANGPLTSARSGSSGRKLRSRDRSMPELVDKVAQIKLHQSERHSGRQVADREHMMQVRSPSKPSSSHSTRSLDTMLKHTSRTEEKVSWTEAFGLLRAIHSLGDIAT